MLKISLLAKRIQTGIFFFETVAIAHVGKYYDDWSQIIYLIDLVTY